MISLSKKESSYYNKKDYLNYLIKEGLLEDDITNVAKMSLDLFIAQAQMILIHDKEIV